MKKNIWEINYQKKRLNKYPFNEIVSNTFNIFKSQKKRKIKVLDLGCGGGTHTKFFIDEGFDYFGIDGSETSIKLTRKIILHRGLKKNVIHSSFKKLPFKNNFFDYIIDRHSLTHNSKSDIEIILREIKRVLKKNGYFFSMVFGNKHHDKKYGKKNYGKKNNIEFYNKFYKGSFSKSGIVLFFGINDIKKLFKDFKIINITETTKKFLVGKKLSKKNLIHSWAILLKS